MFESIIYLLITLSCVRIISVGINLVNFRVKCHIRPCGLGHFVSLVQRFHFSHLGPKKFYHRHFSHWFNFIHYFC
ncbi:hypothetical protein Hanom_Chr07g00644961 [Helianthus anomalus]